MKKITLFLLIIQSFFAYSQCNGRYKVQQYNTFQKQTVEYGKNYRYNGVLQNLNMDIYSPPATDTTKNRPCIVFCFGGAFVQGSRISPELTYFANYFSNLGYVTASIDYRLDDPANMALNSTNESDAVIRAVQDAKAAVRYLKANSNTLGIDSNQIFIGGTSAGGVTAMTLGYAQYSELHPTIQARVDALGGWEGQTNSLPNTSKVLGLFNFSGGISDTSQIQSNDLPIYLNQGTLDKIVPFYWGFPLNGQSKNGLHGSGNIFKRMKNLSNKVWIDSFQIADHPTFSNLAQTLSISVNTSANMTNFFYPLLKCNQVTNASISSSNQQAIKVYPNPIENSVTVEQNTKKKDLVITDAQGKVIQRIVGQNKVVIQTNNWPQGVYWIIAGDENFKIVK